MQSSFGQNYNVLTRMLSIAHAFSACTSILFDFGIMHCTHCIVYFREEKQSHPTWNPLLLPTTWEITPFPLLHMGSALSPHTCVDKGQYLSIQQELWEIQISHSSWKCFSSILYHTHLTCCRSHNIFCTSAISAMITQIDEHRAQRCVCQERVSQDAAVFDHCTFVPNKF